MICGFEFIELVSKKNVYVLENSKPKEYGKSEWSISRLNDTCSEKRRIEPQRRQELNSIVERLNEKYSIISDEEGLLCLYMPERVLSISVKKIEGLLK